LNTGVGKVKLKDILGIVKGNVLTSKVDLDLEIPSCGASDLMSDALAFMKPGSLLLTGLVHPQAIRTAEMADLAAIVFVRGKTPNLDALELAKELDIPLIASPFGMFEMCGLLYQAGLEPVMKNGH
jgi:predicted transcriptional regulator